MWLLSAGKLGQSDVLTIFFMNGKHSMQARKNDMGKIIGTTKLNKMPQMYNQNIPTFRCTSVVKESFACNHMH